MRFPAFAVGLVVSGGLLLATRASADCIDYGSYLHWLGGVVGPGSAYRLAVAGSHAYLAGAGNGFWIVEFSNPRDPHVVSSSDIPCGDVAVSGRYAYVTEYYDSRLDVVDVGDPCLPIVVGQVTLPFSANGVSVSGSYAYVAVGSAGLQVIEVTDPANPRIVGSANTYGIALYVAVSGSHAYVAVENGLRVFDISDPHSPLWVSAVPTLGFTSDVAVSEGHAYVPVQISYPTESWGLQVINITDPRNPRSVGYVPTPGGAYGVAVSGTTAYVACRLAGLQAIDITHPQNPRIVGEVWTGCAWDVSTSGEVACVGNGSGWIMELIDITRPENAPIVGSVETPDEAYGLAISGTYAYIGDRTSGLQVVDFSDSGNPRVVASADLFWAIGVAVSEPYAYVTAGYDARELVVVDISDPLNPHEIGSAVMLGWSGGVAVSGNYAYVGDADAGMTVVDISNPHAPVVVANVATPWWASAMVVSGDYAYVGDAAGLYVVDIEDPLHPWIVGSTNTGTNGIAVRGAYAYATTSQGLQIIDVTSPEKPVIVSTVCTPASANGVAVLEDYAYVGSCTNGGSDVQTTVIDISDPYDPRIIGSFAVGGNVAVTDEHVCVASPESGFHIARLQCGPSGVAEMADPSRSLRLHVFPNPFLRETTIRMQLPAAEYVHATVVDVAGRRVRVLLDGILDSGDLDLHWDGRDDAGREVGPGIYMARVSTSKGARTAQIVMLK